MLSYLPGSVGVACSPFLSVSFDEGMCCEPVLNLAATPDEAVSITSSEDAIWDLQEINFMGVMSKNTPIKLILSITLSFDRDQINFIGKK